MLPQSPLPAGRRAGLPVGDQHRVGDPRVLDMRVHDPDFAKETAELNRQQVLLSTSIALLGLANQKAASILSLLG